MDESLTVVQHVSTVLTSGRRVFVFRRTAPGNEKHTERGSGPSQRFAVHVSVVLEPCWIHPQLNTECFSGKRFFCPGSAVLSVEVLRRNLMAGVYIRL